MDEFEKQLLSAARKKDPRLQYVIGICYSNGYGVEQNNEEAVKWCELAANQGYAKAQCDLGNCLLDGDGITKDPQEAVKWLKLAVEQNNAIAQNDLGWCYESGEGVVKNIKEAIRLYSLAAEQGYWLASRDLGRFYRDGKGVEKDLEKAKKYFQKALDDSAWFEDPAKPNDIEETKNNLAKVEQLIKAAARTDVFISYSHDDADYMKKVSTHLSVLKKTHHINWWCDTQIESGKKWNEEIRAAIAKAKVVVMLVSANFFASDYVWDEELPKILSAAEKEGATILWLLVSACDYETHPIADYQAVIDPKSPLDSLDTSEQHKAYTALVKRIREIMLNQTPATV